MPYIGKTPTVGNFQVCDAISVVNGQAAYTLQVGGVNVAPESANHMLVSLNGILQKPGSSFTISGSTMTFASNLATGDVIDFVQILGNVLDLGTPSDDTVTAAKLNNDIISGQTALAATPADTDEFLISDAGTIKRIDYSYIKGAGAGESNDPSFHVYGGANGSVATSTSVVIANDTELFDSSSAYDTSTYRFTPQVGGYYYFYASVRFQSGTNAFDRINVAIRKNGTEMISGRNDNTDYSTTHVSGIALANGSSDYFDMTAYHTRGSNLSVSTEDELTFFGGFLVKKT